MKILDKYSDFINSNKIEIRDTEEKYTKEFFFKYPLKNDAGYAIYKTSKPFSITSSNDLRYILSVDKDLNVLHINDDIFNDVKLVYFLRPLYRSDYQHLLGEKIDFEYLSNFNNLNFKDIENTFRFLLKKKLSELNKDLDKEYKYEKYKNLAQEKYKEKMSMKHPVDDMEFLMSIDIVADVVSEKLEENGWDYIDENLLNKYKEYYLAQKAIKDYEMKIEENPELNKQKQIIDILLNDNYKSFQIYYRLPDNTQEKFSYKKGTMKYGNVNKDIVENNIIYNIPISAIEKITYRKDCLFDGGKKKYDFKKLALDYSKARQDPMYDKCLDCFGNDRDVVLKMMENEIKSKNNICFPVLYANKKINQDIVNDINFFKEVYQICKNEKKENQSCFIPFCNLNKELYKQEEFFNLVLENQLFATYSFEDYFQEIKDEDFINKTAITRLLQEDIPIECFLPYTDHSLLEDKKILEEINKKINSLDNYEKEYRNNRIINILIENNVDFNLIKEVFDLSNLNLALDKLPTSLLMNKSFVKEMLSSGQKITLWDKKIIDIYKDDKEMHTDLIKAFDSSSPDMFLDKINRKDAESRFEFANINPIFIDTLNETEKEVFFSNEIEGIENIKIKKEENLTFLYIQTAFGYFMFNKESERLFFQSTDTTWDYKHYIIGQEDLSIIKKPLIDSMCNFLNINTKCTNLFNFLNEVCDYMGKEKKNIEKER